MVLDLAAVSATPAVPVRCCRPGACEYGIDRVRHHLARWLAYQRAGEQPGQIYAAPTYGRFGGTPGDGETASLDIGRVVEQLRVEGQPISAETVASRLCPFAITDEGQRA